jgi:hypothetical protein
VGGLKTRVPCRGEREGPKTRERVGMGCWICGVVGTSGGLR